MCSAGGGSEVSVGGGSEVSVGGGSEVSVGGGSEVSVGGGSEVSDHVLYITLHIRMYVSSKTMMHCVWMVLNPLLPSV